MKIVDLGGGLQRGLPLHPPGLDEHAPQGGRAGQAGHSSPLRPHSHHLQGDRAIFFPLKFLLLCYLRNVLACAIFSFSAIEFFLIDITVPTFNVQRTWIRIRSKIQTSRVG